MKYYEFQRELLKLTSAREEKGKVFHPSWFRDGERTYISPDGTFLIGIPDKIFYLDINKIALRPEWSNGTDMIKKAWDADEAVLTSVTMETTISGKKEKVRRINCGDKKIWANTICLKYFDNCEFRATGPTAPVYATVFEDVVGLIMPVNMNGVNEE